MLHILWRASKVWSSDSVKDASVQQEESAFADTVPLHTLPNLSPSVSERNWTAILRDLQVLHNILKDCKQGAASKLNIFFNSCKFYVGEVLAAFTKVQLQCSNMRHKVENELALGALLRLLCSIIHSLSVQSDYIKAGDFIGKSEILASMETFMPALSFLCLVHSDRTCVSHYLCCKYQMLLFRLREWFAVEPSLAVMCFEILKSHVYLFGALFQRQPQLVNPLLGSPFAPFLTEQERWQSVSPPTCQLYRHAVFLAFKVVLSLKEVSHHVNTGIEKVSERDVLGLREQYTSPVEQWLLNWLSMQINLIVDIAELEIHKIADGLAVSFIEIFVNEDTLMLEMLLLLLDISELEVFPLFIDAGDESPQVTHNLLVSIFKPLRLFAIFLFVIQYDHLIIVDFLISKDTSILCLRYLLRCLHITQSTWPEFLSVSCSWSGEKKWKDRSHLLETKRKMQTGNVTDGVLSCVRQRQGESSYISDTMIDVKKAASCLLNLKFAVERLHQKHIFPYNPSALLRNLEIFQQLWKL